MLDDPATPIPPQCATILRYRTNAILLVRADQFDASLRQPLCAADRCRLCRQSRAPASASLGPRDDARGAIFFHCASVSNGPDRAIGLSSGTADSAYPSSVETQLPSFHELVSGYATLLASSPRGLNS